MKRHRAEVRSSTLKNGAMWEREATLITSLMSQLDAAQSKQEFEKTLNRWIYDSESPLVESVAAVRTPSAQSKYQKRQGARAIRQLEHAADESMRLTPEGATTLRALSARCNYMAQDRPGIAYSSKELCRDFSVPTTASLAKLKRLMR